MNPPKNQDLERLVVGAMLDCEGPLVMTRARQMLADTLLVPEDFTLDICRAAVGGIQALAEHGESVSGATAFLRAADLKLPGVTGSGLLELERLQASNVANREQLLTHARELRYLSKLRRVQSFLYAQGVEVGKPRAKPEAIAEAMSEFVKELTSLEAGEQTAEGDVLALAEEMEASVSGRREVYVPSGVRVIDREVGGWVPNLNVVAGLEGVGKSAFAAESVVACLQRGVRVGFFGLEDGTKWIAKRHLARAVGVPVGELLRGLPSKEQQDLWMDRGPKMAALLRNMLVWRTAGITPEQLLAVSRRWILTQGVKLIFVDHGGEVAHNAGAARDRYDLAVAATYRGLRDLAVNFQVPVVVLAHLNADAEKEPGAPRLGHLAETKYIARMARLALGLWQRPGDDRLLCTVLKRTEGERGQTVAIPRDAPYALLKRDEGTRLDLQQEAADAKARTDAARSLVSTRVGRSLRE